MDMELIISTVVRISSRGIWSETIRQDGVGNDMNFLGIQGSPKHGVLLAGVGDADDIINIGKCEFEHFVCQDAASVRKAKQRMISKCTGNSHSSGMKNTLVA